MRCVSARLPTHCTTTNRSVEPASPKMADTEIENFASLVSFGPLKKIKGYKVARLTAPGENYGSLMLSVDVTLQGGEEVHCVAKMVPPNEAIQEIFNTSVTFRNEIEFYKNIVPTLVGFQKENGVKELIDFFPRYYGSRLNLSSGTTVDSSAALVLENLKVAKYVGLDRIEGLNLDVAKLILRNLAQLHAVPLALKLRKPEVFDKEVKPYLSPWMPKEDMHNAYRKAIEKMIQQVPPLQRYHQRILTGFDRELVSNEPREPFATIAHNDCWVNNNMVKYDGTKAVDSKMVDYQVCGYGSPARDIVFFLFSSVKTEVLKESFDDLLRYYHEVFTSLLGELGCDVQKFGFDALLKEIDVEARDSQFGHLAFMLFVVFVVKEQIKDIAEFSVDNIVAGDATEAHKEKFLFVVEEFARRGWI